MDKRNNVIKPLIGLIIIYLVATWVFSQSLSFDFTYLDDQEQIVQNPNIKSLNFNKLIDIFKSTSVGMYQPISTFFYAIVHTIGGLNPKAYHILSLVFHFLNILLVFQVFKKFHFTTNLALILTAIFAVHPMQVESITWLSAYSNLCFSFFFLLALLSYIKFTDRNYKVFYFLSLVLFILSGLAKSTAVVFPIVLIAYDFIIKEKALLKASLNKLPFLIVSIGLGIITIVSRESAGHLSDLSISFSWFDRIFLICHSILFYPVKFIAPINLSAFYAYPELSNGNLPALYYLSPLAILLIGVLLWRFRPNKVMLFGMVFYAIGISLVLQFIPVGNQLTTDRYIYLPMLGFLLIIAHFLSKLKSQKLVPFLIIIPLLLALLSYERTKVWENDKSIWTDVITKNPKVAQAYNNLGSYALKENNGKLAMQHFNKAIELKPYYADAYSNRGSLYADLGNSEKAFQDLNQAIQLRPHADAYYNRANEFVKMKDLNSALADYAESLKLKPSPDAYTNRAFVYAQMRQTQKAMDDLNRAIRLNQNYGQAYFLKGMIYNGEGNKNQACSELNKAARLNHVKAKQAIQQLCR